MMIHLAAHATPGIKPLTSAHARSWLWPRLRESFPAAFAATLMLEHIHLLEPTDDADAERLRLAKLLGAFTRFRHCDAGWSAAKPTVIPDSSHLKRQVRYVHLNPCRARLVDDPLVWRHSTHRGLVGAEVDPWVQPEYLAPWLGKPTEGFSEWLHAYVSGDPDVRIDGTPFPTAAAMHAVPVRPLYQVIQAAFAAAPWSKLSEQRRLAVHLAHHQGWTDTTMVGAALGISPQMVRRLAKLARCPADLHAARLCLGDVRLLRGYSISMDPPNVKSRANAET